MRNNIRTILLCCGFVIANAQAAGLNDVLSSEEVRANAAKSSQQKIDASAEQTRDLLTDYRQTAKLLDDLKVYNRKLEIQIENQEKRLVQIDQSIANVQVMQRQITPLIVKMIDRLESFIALDLPFYQEERQERIKFLKSSLDRPDLSSAEKFRQVLEAYKIESEYGRKVDTYSDVVQIEGEGREASILLVGRLALLYQTTDMEKAGVWSQDKNAWVELDAGDYKDVIRKGVRIAKKQASIDILNLPVALKGGK